MAVLVSDTSVLIDLERGGILVPAFSCGLSMVVPDYLYELELESFNGPYLRALGLGVLSLTPDELSLVQEIKNNCPELSTPDSFALTLSIRQGHALVTGDKNLRGEAAKRGISVYGLLWLLDQLEVLGVEKSILYQGLTSIFEDPRCRLPKDEVQSRLKQWS